jgi:hypothetical protein
MFVGQVFRVSEYLKEVLYLKTVNIKKWDIKIHVLEHWNMYLPEPLEYRLCQLWKSNVAKLGQFIQQNV